MSNPIKKTIRSFKYALNGIVVLIRDERNAKIHLVALIAVIAAGIFFDINRSHWLLIALAVSLVFITEAFNTAFEKLVDYITMERHPELKKIKDIAAGAVLIAAIFALITAGYVFIPYLI